MADRGIEEAATRLPVVVGVRRRGPILKPSRVAGIFGVDVTSGCSFGCRFCHVRQGTDPQGRLRLLFDPTVAERLAEELDACAEKPAWIVLSPGTDPLPPHHAVRAAVGRVLDVLAARSIGVQIMTRARVPRSLAERLAEHPGGARVMVGLTTLDRALARQLEPNAPSPLPRVHGLADLIERGVDTEARLEPLIPGLTDTRQNLLPLFRALKHAGVRRVVVHYLFWHTMPMEPLRSTLSELGVSEQFDDAYEGGPVVSVGSLGPVKQLPVARRRESLARVAAWGAEHGLVVEVGSSQNPDLPRKLAPPARPAVVQASFGFVGPPRIQSVGA